MACKCRNQRVSTNLIFRSKEIDIELEKYLLIISIDLGL
jgi:hypothetical protein